MFIITKLKSFKKKIQKVIVEKLLQMKKLKKEKGIFFSRKDFKRIFKKRLRCLLFTRWKGSLLGKFRKNVLTKRRNISN